MGAYIPTAILPFATLKDDKWVNELRHITVLFVNLGVPESELVRMHTPRDVDYINSVLQAVRPDTASHSTATASHSASIASQALGRRHTALEQRHTALG
jgi:hypothetical protein